MNRNLRQTGLFVLLAALTAPLAFGCTSKMEPALQAVGEQVGSGMTHVLTPDFKDLTKPHTETPKVSVETATYTSETRTTRLVNVSAITFNAGLIPGLSKGLKPRAEALCGALKTGHWDFAFLQEVWGKDEREILKHCGFDHVVDLDEKVQGKMFDSGLMILSRHPLKLAQKHAYSENGRADRAMKDGEALVRKSLLLAQAEVKDMGTIWLVTTHLVSHYFDAPTESYLAQRALQIGEMKQKLDTIVGPTLDKIPALVGGDFNLSPFEKDRAHDAGWDALVAALPGYQRASMIDRCTSCTTNKNNLTGEDGLVDHIFGSAGFKPVTASAALQGDFNLGTELGNAPLSDHWALSATFERIAK